jgi:hypothetical protein
MAAVTILAMLAQAAATATAAAGPIRLKCDGSGAVERRSVTWLASGRLSTTYREGSQREQVLFELKEGVARLRLPDALVTQVHSGGDADGWWTATDLQVTEAAIRGRLRINLVNKPSFRIDRYTGAFDLDGLMPFHGDCERMETQQRKF